MTCSGCSHVNESGRRYCGQCGLDNRPACTRCGFGNSASDRFCGGCGNGMVKAAAVGAGTAAASAVSAARRVSALPPPPTTFAAAARANDPPSPVAVALPKAVPAAALAPPPSVTVDVDGILSAAELQLLITPKPQAAAKAEPELAKDHVTQDDLDSLFEANS